MLDREQVIWAYRCFFGREPENDDVIELHRHYPNWNSLRQAFATSNEFEYVPQTALGAGRFARAPHISVELPKDSEQLQRMFDHVAASWAKLGREEPHWSVVTSENFKSDRIAETEQEFYASGQGDAELVRAFFARNERSPASIETCLEFGCGVGRATSALAQMFPKVYGIDISAPHLQLARSWFAKVGITNVDTIQLHNVQDVSNLPEFDLLYSTIVFQHNPPPVIAHLLDSLFAKLKPGGYVLFQVPTYRAGYRFALNEYLDHASPGMEMHALPQQVIFQLFQKHGMTPIEIQEDGLTGSEAFLSQTFFARRRESATIKADHCSSE